VRRCRAVVDPQKLEEVLLFTENMETNGIVLLNCSWEQNLQNQEQCLHNLGSPFFYFLFILYMKLGSPN
jgi:hypothetical protein